MAYTPLLAVLGLLMIDCLIEVGFVGSTVGYLHKSNNGKPFDIVGPNNTRLQLLAKPKHLSVDQGHTSNGAAGTALILVGVVGFVVIWRQKMMERKTAHRPFRILLAWTVMTVLSFLLTTAALIYTFIMTEKTNGQSITVSKLQKSGSNLTPYDQDTWTPETWYEAVLDLKFENEENKSDVRKHVKMMHGWRWNLIPMFLLGLTVCVLAVLSLRHARSHAYRDVVPMEEKPGTRERSEEV